MNIKFVEYKIGELKFSPSSELLENLSNLDSINIDDHLVFKPIFFKDSLKNFVVKFHLEVKTEEASFFELDFLSKFVCEQDIDDGFKKSNFPIINAPAIAYPFLRAFVSNFFVSAGYYPILLPTYNFTKFKKST
ncbi:protein-export chaperone SecB [Acinetobacter sp. YH12128]|uniref:protein-export chaperone SecB n=1 Tax=Acinetobacter sp. YH12128 TaxID=2601113 RepID=UPI0015D16038|nr:protein-export chaperone SecB [Acinetobacter sp. YH12128]